VAEIVRSSNSHFTLDACISTFFWTIKKVSRFPCRRHGRFPARYDVLRMDAEQTKPPETITHAPNASRLPLLLGALGVVFGDIGTSPL